MRSIQQDLWKLALLGCIGIGSIGCDNPDISPSLKLKSLIEPSVRIDSPRRALQGTDVYTMVTVYYAYHDPYCGTVHGISATWAGTPMHVLSEGLRSYPSDYDGNMRCDLPEFYLQPDDKTLLGDLTISDGETTWTAHDLSIDPGDLKLTSPVPDVMHVGDTLTWNVTVPNAASANYSVGFSPDNIDQTELPPDWASGTGLGATLSVAIPAGTTGGGSVVSGWGLSDSSVPCDVPNGCVLSLSGLSEPVHINVQP